MSGMKCKNCVYGNEAGGTEGLSMQCKNCVYGAGGADRTDMQRLEVTVDKISPFKGGFSLRVISGSIGFYVSIPGKENPFKPGDELVLEWPKGSRMLFDPYTAIYKVHHASQS